MLWERIPLWEHLLILFPFVKVVEDPTEEVVPSETRSACKAFDADQVSKFNEIAAAKGCLGRFPGSETMGIIKKFLKLKND